MTNHKTLAEAIKRTRGEGDRLTYTPEELEALETAYLELWARVQELEGACAGLVKILNEHEDKGPLPDIALMFCWMAAQNVRAALRPPETDQ